MTAAATCTYTSELYERPALTSSAPLAWPGVRVERYQLEAMTMPAHYHAQHLLLVHQGQQPGHPLGGGGRAHAAPGSAAIAARRASRSTTASRTAEGPSTRTSAP